MAAQPRTPQHRAFGRAADPGGERGDTYCLHSMDMDMDMDMGRGIVDSRTRIAGMPGERLENGSGSELKDLR